MLLLCCLISRHGYSQSKSGIYVDKQGVLRWKKDHSEATFFGTNYTVPFAYGYRSHQALQINHEKAIDQDVYHFARLGFDAFRVHVWDTEITDSLGNLLENEHLRLFDYLIFKLKERNIKVMLTPLAFWGNGYPEPDQKTAGFSSIYNKRQAVTEEKAIRAQENYVSQFFKHVNVYTKLSYENDPDVLAAEINNEPHHSGPKQRAGEYVNRLARAIRNAGWTKPVFYNISESPWYADAVANAEIDGVSFQWYPTGLVANHTLPGNYLPHVDRYHIPFDTIPAFANKARMVYEFDAGDIWEPVMYPAMARSFRGAGFQWATQFAYDPLATAYANTEYQTHFVNLAYTPSKAISLMIAAKAFHILPRSKSYGTYPADSVFGPFRVSYRESLSEMNTEKEFYYSNTTSTKPVNNRNLLHVAGVGSCSIVSYKGLGAYFLDKLENGIWRLEVMPDAIMVSDPFAKAAPQKEVVRIQWKTHALQIKLPDLGVDFTITGVNEGNTFSAKAVSGSIKIQPGTYLLVKNGRKFQNKGNKSSVIKLNEFVAPVSRNTTPTIWHTPHEEVSSGNPFKLQAQIAGLEDSSKVTLLINNLSGVYKTIAMQEKTAYTYVAEVPVELTTPGLVQYRILVEKSKGEFYTFPGNYKGYPYAWDYYQKDSWQTYVAAEKSSLELFNASRDRNPTIYPNLWRSDEKQFITSQEPGQLVFRLASKELGNPEHIMGFQHTFADKIKGRQSELDSFKRLVIKARTGNTQPVQIKIALLTIDGMAFSSTVTLTSAMQELSIPLGNLKPDRFILLPRPYPGFQPFWFKSSAAYSFQVSQAEKLQITIGENLSSSEYEKPYNIEVESISLEN
ncbi:cellulase family glycosylhydrolase [Rhodocytophaga rosea]|nr:cellulase family glycosylhydrolase [Rhodocytophaga rosea]